jgi:hypothetical protein
VKAFLELTEEAFGFYHVILSPGEMSRFSPTQHLTSVNSTWPNRQAFLQVTPGPFRPLAESLLTGFVGRTVGLILDPPTWALT